jgi:hypothetical protein
MSASIRWDPVWQGQEGVSVLTDPIMSHILVEHCRRGRLEHWIPSIATRHAYGRRLRPRNGIREGVALVLAGHHLVSSSIIVTRVLVTGALLDIGTSEVAALGAWVVGRVAALWFVAL